MKLMHLIEKESDSQYCLLYLTIMPIEDENSRFYSDNLKVTIKWQTDKDRFLSENPWYAGKLQVESEYLDHIVFAQKLMKKLVGQDGSLSYMQPEQVIERLKSIRVVKDYRLGEYVPIEKLIDTDKNRWLDDYTQLGRVNCTYDCLATSADEAKKLILMKAAEYGDTNYIQEFIAAGSPVKIDTWSKVKPVVATEELLKPSFR